MTIPARPRLRPVDAHMQEVDGQPVVILRDPFDLTDAVLALPLAAAMVLNYCDGARTLEEVAAAVETDHGLRVPLDQLRAMLETLDTHTFLDSPTYHDTRARVEREFAAAAVRDPSLAGRSYPDDAPALREWFGQLFLHEDGPGRVPNGEAPSGSLRAAVVPHIDYLRGSPTYGHGYGAIADHADADVWVVLGTGHGELHNLYAATWKDFATPFGAVPTDRAFLDTVQAHVPLDLRADEFAHRGEHSIEFQAVLLHYLYGGRRDFTLVPILCGSYHPFVHDGTAPRDAPGVRGMIDGLRAATAEARAAGKRVCFLASADLAHMGPKFGDPRPIDDAARGRIEAADRQMLESVVAADAPAFFEAIRAVSDARRVCGTSCIYTMLEALGPARGELLQYRQWPDPNDCVTFASIAFHED